MKTKFLPILIISAILCMTMVGCRGSQKISSSYSNYQFGTSLVSTSPSGLLTLRSWGSGPDKNSAIKEAMKNAVYDVIFKGVKGGNGSYATQPIVTEVNARERYAEYFDRFFAPVGEWERFVKETSSKDKSRTESKSSGRVNYGITVTIDRPYLVRQLTEDNIIVNK